MKKALIVLAVMVATLCLGLTEEASAFNVGDNYSVGSGVVSFYLVDGAPGDSDNQVVMTASTLGPSIGGPIANFQYSLDNITWSSFSGTNLYSGTATVAIDPATHAHLMYLRYGGTDPSADTMTFTSWTSNSGSHTKPSNLDMFTGLMVNFNGAATAITFVSNAGNDKIAPVPIPGALWLFAPALAGLVGLRRRFIK
jgi:hypothetical protein